MIFPLVGPLTSGLATRYRRFPWCKLIPPHVAGFLNIETQGWTTLSLAAPSRQARLLFSRFTPKMVRPAEYAPRVGYPIKIYLCRFRAWDIVFIYDGPLCVINVETSVRWSCGLYRRF